MRRTPLLLLPLLLALSLPQAQAAPTVTLRHPAKATFWTGGPVEGAALPEACAALACDEVALEVDLKDQHLKHPGGVQVAIRWVGESNDLDLYVYDDAGALAAQSAGPVSTSEAVLLPLANATYRVVVAPAGSDPVTYEGLAQVERAIDPEPARDLVPDLISLPARQPQIATSAYLFDLPVPSLPNGCYPEETAEQDAMRCLRFDQIIANVGTGPFEIRYRLDDLAGTQAIEQRIHRSDGTHRDVRADTYELHPTHAHFHYTNFAQAHLWRSNEAGERLGEAPIRSGRKNGFCMVDVELHWWGLRGDAPRTYIPPGCLAANEIDPAAGRVAAVNGISVGWGDVYNWHLADQFIEVTGVPDGHYLIESVADPAGTIVEGDDANNTAFAHIVLCGDDAQLAGVPGPCTA